MSFSTRATESGCASSDLTDEEVDHLRTELAKVTRLFAKPFPATGNTKRESSHGFTALVCFISPQMEEEIQTLRQVLLLKEKDATDIRRQLGLSPISHLKQNLSKGWHDVQTSTP